MRHVRALGAVLAAIVATGCATAPSRPPPGMGGVSGERLQALSSSIRDDVKRGAYPGAVALVVRGGEVVLSEVAGVQDPRSGAPMRADSIFRVASMTKPVVGVAAMILVQEGKVGLADPVSRYLPELKGLKVGVVKKDAAGAEVLEEVPALREPTVQDLLRHTSGFTYGFFGKTPVKQRYVEAGIPYGPGLTTAAFLERLSKIPLAYQPGTTWEYGVSFDVLGVLVERVSGKGLDAFVAERITGPLRMKDTGFSVAPAGHGRIAEPFGVDPDSKAKVVVSEVRTPPKFLSGGGGLVSTAADYARFAQMLLNGGELDGVRILSPKIVEYMTADQLGPGVVRTAGYLPGPGYGFGLGFAVRTSEGGPAAPGSVGDFVWNGSMGTMFFVDPREKLVAVLLVQRPMEAMGPTWRRFRTMVYAALE
jgi:CubicO group peptidase (beta-lactamase class C family)